MIDIRMAPDHTDEGARAAREIRASLRTLVILVLSQYVDEHYALELMAQGLSNKAISEHLVVTGRAADHHVTSIFTKLGLPASERAHRRVLAALTFLNNQAG